MRAEQRRRRFDFLLPSRLAALVALIACAASTRPAAAFCRTTSCPFPAGFIPSDGQCVPPDFDARCASMDPPMTNVPVFWSNACVSYDIQQKASKQVPYDKAVVLFAAAFAKWTSTTCASAGGGRVSINVTNLGPVECDKVQYNSDQGNQHVIIFYDDDTWPYDDSANTLGLTTITFDPDTGEIYDADMEINSTVPLTVGDPVPQGGYDFESIITHESGHFLGMAHSGDARATMYAHYAIGTTTMRELTADDFGGMCSIYLPDGDRVVDPSVTPDGSGKMPEATCDPTPRHGFSTQCAQPQSKGCNVSGSGSGSSGGGGSLAVGAALALAAGAGMGVGKRRRTT
jgi:Matrixin